MELNLRLDQNGRTTFDPAALQQHQGEAIPKKCSTTENVAKRAKIEATSETTVDYSSKTTLTSLHDYKIEGAMDSLLFDCEITDCGLLPRTFWVPATGMEPRCYLEKMALQIFHHHVPRKLCYDPATSGAEWWVQIRPSPPAGRYSMLYKDDDADGQDDMAKSGISFHWDKDEDLRLLCGGSMYIHPHLSTVTYMTDLGAPTMVLSRRVDPMTGENISEDSNTDGLICWPKRGKHLSFDGRYLHAAPSDLMEDGVFEKQCTFIKEGLDKKEANTLERRSRRVTFLVNIWLNYKPFNVSTFPDTMLSKLSKTDLFGELELFGGRAMARQKDAKVHVASSGAMEMTETAKSSVCDVSRMKWPMGSCDEQIEIPIPIEVVRKCFVDGSNVNISWQADLIRLSDKK